MSASLSVFIRKHEPNFVDKVMNKLEVTNYTPLLSPGSEQVNAYSISKAVSEARKSAGSLLEMVNHLLEEAKTQIDLCDLTEVKEMLLEAEALYSNSPNFIKGGHGSKKTDAGDVLVDHVSGLLDGIMMGAEQAIHQDFF